MTQCVQLSPKCCEEQSQEDGWDLLPASLVPGLLSQENKVESNKSRHKMSSYVCAQTHTFTSHTYISPWTYTYMHTCTHTCTHALSHIHIHMCTCVHTHTSPMHAHAHLHTHVLTLTHTHHTPHAGMNTHTEYVSQRTKYQVRSR